jgi:molybdopterin-guanine dinucleotide biosynthesis protein A
VTPREEPRTAAVVLAGGGSTRFGEADKALASLLGVPMVDHVAARLAPVVDEVLVNCRERQRDALAAAVPDARLAVDAEPDRGPLYGIRTGLEATVADHVAVVGCDMPLVDPTFVDALLGFLGDAEAAIPRRADGWFVPTQAAYRREAMLDAATAALEGDDGRVLAATDRLDVRVVEEAEAMALADEHTFFDANTREDLARAEAFVAAREPRLRPVGVDDRDDG